MENERRQKMKIHSIKIASKNKSKNLIIFEAVSNREFIHIILNTHTRALRQQKICEEKMGVWHTVSCFLNFIKYSIWLEFPADLLCYEPMIDFSIVIIISFHFIVTLFFLLLLWSVGRSPERHQFLWFFPMLSFNFISYSELKRSFSFTRISCCHIYGWSEHQLRYGMHISEIIMNSCQAHFPISCYSHTYFGYSLGLRSHRATVSIIFIKFFVCQFLQVSKH